MKHQTIIPLFRLSSRYNDDPTFRLLVEQVEEYSALDFEMESLQRKPPKILTVLSGITILVLSFTVVLIPHPSREFKLAAIVAISICTLGVMNEAFNRLKEKMRIQHERLCIKTYLEEIVCSKYLLEIEKFLIEDEGIKFENTEIIEKFFQVIRAILELDPRDYNSYHSALLLHDSSVPK